MPGCHFGTPRTMHTACCLHKQQLLSTGPASKMHRMQISVFVPTYVNLFRKLQPPTLLSSLAPDADTATASTHAHTCVPAHTQPPTHNTPPDPPICILVVRELLNE